MSRPPHNQWQWGSRAGIDPARLRRTRIVKPAGMDETRGADSSAAPNDERAGAVDVALCVRNNKNKFSIILGLVEKKRKKKFEPAGERGEKTLFIIPAARRENLLNLAENGALMASCGNFLKKKGWAKSYYYSFFQDKSWSPASYQQEIKSRRFRTRELGLVHSFRSHRQ